MKIKTHLINIVILSLIFVSCDSNQEQNANANSSVVDFPKIEIDALPIHGTLNEERLAKYYPKVTDKIKDLGIVGADKIDVNPEEEIIVSLLHNTGSFHEMIICTHNKKLDLIDHLYIGKATDFDNGKSHTIHSEIKQNKIIFHQVDWGYVKKENEEEIDTVNYEFWTVSIDKDGRIIHRKTMLRANEKEKPPLEKPDSLFTLDLIEAENFVRIKVPIGIDFSLPDDSAKTEPFKIADFNGDEKNDVLVYLGACGTGGCMYGLFLNQSDNFYELAFMDYLKNPVFEKEENGFLTIKSFEEVEPYNPSKLYVSIFRFDSKEYQLDTTYVFNDDF